LHYWNPAITFAQIRTMKNTIILYALILVFFASCARAVTPAEAASGRYKKCRPVK
jgi:hypothetical protein